MTTEPALALEHCRPLRGSEHLLDLARASALLGCLPGWRKMCIRDSSLWWLYVWLFWCAFNLLILFIYPTWICLLYTS